MSGTLPAVGLAGVLAATLLGAPRWLRIAQREHYLAGAVSRFARRWWSASPANLAGAVVVLGALVATPFVPPVALLGALMLATFPLGLTIRGRTAPLRWTRRLVSVAVVAGVVTATAVTFGGVLDGVRGALVGALAAGIAAPGLCDLALALLAPLEERLARPFVDQAAGRIAAVRPAIVAITGSYGKTTTKGHLAHLLAGRFTVLASPRSFNNRAGLARTVNEHLVPGTDVLVAEMGAYGPGEIAALCAWLPPRVAVITAIGPVHLERFKDLEATLAAKAEITEGAEVSVLNTDDDRLARLADHLVGKGRRVLRCSARDPRADVALLGDDDGLELVVAGVSAGRVAVAVQARPSALGNVACALGAALSLGATPSELLARLAGLPVTENRLAATTAASGVVVLDDTFNSNPAGARLALERLGALGGPDARRVLVTPGMVELGPLQGEENAAFAHAACAVADDVVLVARTNRRALLAGCARAGRSPGGPGVVVVSTRAEAVAWVRETLRAGDVVCYENDLPDHFP